jgi:hypothetical protein
MGLAVAVIAGCSVSRGQGAVARYQPQAFFETFQQEHFLAESLALMLSARTFHEATGRWPATLKQLRQHASSMGRPLTLELIRQVKFKPDARGEVLLLITYQPAILQARRGRSGRSTVGLVLSPPMSASDSTPTSGQPRPPESVPIEAPRPF